MEEKGNFVRNYIRGNKDFSPAELFKLNKFKLLIFVETY